MQRLLEIMEQLEDKNYWFPTSTAGCYIRKGKKGSYLFIGCNEERITTLGTRDARRVRESVEEELNDNPKLTLQTVDAAISARADEIMQTAGETMEKLRQGPAWQESEYAFNGFMDGLFYRVNHSHGNSEAISSVAKMKEERVFRFIVDYMANNNKEPQLITPSPRLLEKIATHLFPERHLDLLRSGKLKVGGGATTDTGWSMQRSDDKYIITSSEDYTTNTRTIPEQEALEIITKKRYAWIRIISRP
ncbi:MAG: hypothetical protein GY765_11715 [bacterium]|nr:hypothetical protein [bacterium]